MKLVVGGTYKVIYRADGVICTVEHAVYDGESVGIYDGCAAGTPVFTDRDNPRRRVAVPCDQLIRLTALS